MKRLGILLVAAAAMAASAFAQTKQGSLEQALAAMDRASDGFKSVQADFEWDVYTAPIPDADVQTGVIYFRREKSGVEMAADIQKNNGNPSPHYVLYTGGGLVQVFLPRANEVTRYQAGKNKQDFESYLVLGFGGRGSDLAKSFEVRYAGMENISGRPTYKLELTPRSANARGFFKSITLWVDAQNGMSLQQRFQSSGSDKLAKYSNFKLNQPLPGGAFKLKTNSKTTYIEPHQ